MTNDNVWLFKKGKTATIILCCLSAHNFEGHESLVLEEIKSK